VVTPAIVNPTLAIAVGIATKFPRLTKPGPPSQNSKSTVL